MRSPEWLRLEEGQRQLIESYQTALPVKVVAIASALGVVVKKSTLQAGISGEIRRSNGTVEIKINRHDVIERQRFTLAHEIAHFLLHSDRLDGNGIVDDVLYRSGLSDDLEAQANRLAADIVMPMILIQQKLQEKGGGKLTEQQIEEIAQDAQVSKVALKIRLGK